MKPRPGRARGVTRGRIASWAVLAFVGCAAALTYVYGDPVSRTVAFAALLAGSVLACLLAWRQNRGAERSHQAAQLGQAMRHGEDLHAERVRHQAVLRTMSARLGGVRDQLAEADRRASALQRQLSTLRGNYESLRVELELQAALAEAAPVLELAGVADPPDPWVTARELWRIPEAPAAKRPA